MARRKTTHTRHAAATRRHKAAAKRHKSARDVHVGVKRTVERTVNAPKSIW